MCLLQVHRSCTEGTMNLSLFLFFQLDECGNAVLADFGLAKTFEQLDAQAPGKWVPQGKPTGGFNKRRMVGTTQYAVPFSPALSDPPERCNSFMSRGFCL